MNLTCPASPQRGFLTFDIAAPPAWCAAGSPEHTSSAPPRSVQTDLKHVTTSGRDIKHMISQESHWPSWSPPGPPSCSHTSWRDQRRSAPLSWDQRAPDPSLESTVWLIYCRRGSSAAACPLHTNKQEHKRTLMCLQLIQNWWETKLWNITFLIFNKNL